ncbi:MAG: RecB family exonuclease [Stackebrandtia sp.]
MSSSPAAPVSLSPSRAADFKQCPLLYRLRVIDKLPEPATPAMVKGTLVHSVLERLYDLSAQERTPERAVELLEPEWRRLCGENPEAAALFVEAGDGAEEAWLKEGRALVESYFSVEDPRRLDPQEREFLVEAEIDGGPRLRGYVDRLDVAPGGEIRVVDYKTGASPKPAFQAQALFQLKFYALVLWKTRGTLPRMLRLLYLKDSSVIDYAPDEDEIRGVERTISALWTAIGRAVSTGEFPPRKSALCGWCAHQSSCPEFGGAPPPYPLPIKP